MAHIRYATIHDNILLAEIGAETFYDSFAAVNTPENMAAYLSGSFSPERQGYELAAPHAKFLIAEINGAAAAYAHLKFGVAPAAVMGRKPMEIGRFYARKQWIGQGVGADLMTGCLQEGRARGCDVVWLDVWEHNLRAIRFYRKWGFVEVGKQHFQLGDDLQDDLLMARPLDNGIG